jgi:hypothetical protein
MKLILSGMLKRILKILMTAVLFMVLLANLGAGSMKVDKKEIQVTGKVYLMGVSLLPMWGFNWMMAKSML